MLLGLSASAQTSTPDAPSAAPAAITQVLARWDAEADKDLKAVVVRQRGRIIAERYYNGEAPATLHDVRSAGKSITSLLVGAALDRKCIRSLTDPLERYVTEAKGRPSGTISLDQILTMRSGLQADDRDPESPGHEDRLDASPDPFQFALSLPVLPGRDHRYVYNSATAYLAGLAVEGATGRSLEAFAAEALFKPLGITRWHWAKDAAGHAKGQGNLSLTARDFSSIGQLVLNRGTYESRRILSASWIEESLRPRVAIGIWDPYADHYGYFWYSKTHAARGEPVQVSFASGNGGNKIYVVPSRDLVVAITSSAYGQARGQRRSEAILKALLEAIPSKEPR
ncbi:MAG: serine hydrolase [Acidobacteria bacterium]|nr:serine hydrolase [Acidobacteriota bacterium]MBI3487921.1 serine hydrolase [Acidobacteriota bacterium]